MFGKPFLENFAVCCCFFQKHTLAELLPPPETSAPTTTTISKADVIAQNPFDDQMPVSTGQSPIMSTMPNTMANNSNRRQQTLELMMNPTAKQMGLQVLTPHKIII